MRRGLTDIVFGHIEKNSFALYNSCVKSGCFGLKRFNKFLYFLYTEKVAAYIQRSVKFWTWQAKKFPYIQFGHYFLEKERFWACQRVFLYIRMGKYCICPK